MVVYKCVFAVLKITTKVKCRPQAAAGMLCRDMWTLFNSKPSITARNAANGHLASRIFSVQKIKIKTKLQNGYALRNNNYSTEGKSQWRHYWKQVSINPRRTTTDKREDLCLFQSFFEVCSVINNNDIAHATQCQVCQYDVHFTIQVTCTQCWGLCHHWSNVLSQRQTYMCHVEPQTAMHQYTEYSYIQWLIIQVCMCVVLLPQCQHRQINQLPESTGPRNLALVIESTSDDYKE